MKKAGNCFDTHFTRRQNTWDFFKWKDLADAKINATEILNLICGGLEA